MIYGASIRIRQPKIEDSPGIARVQVDSHQSAYTNILPQAYLAHFTYEEQTQDWRNWMNTPEREMLFVTENESGEIVGYALGRISSDEDNASASELVALHVRRTFQSQGIGRQLIAAVAEELRQRGCSSLMLQTLARHPTRSLYEKLGGQLEDEQNWADNAEFGVNVTEVTLGRHDISALRKRARNVDCRQRI